MLFGTGLLLANSVRLFVMVLVYSMQEWLEECAGRYSSLLERLESPVNLAAVSGGIATLVLTWQLLSD